MALYWEWKDKVGESIFENLEGKEYTINLYQGNAFLIFINEYTETDDNGEVHNMYNLHSFFCDEAHAKRCLGLVKDTSNIFADGFCRMKKIRINKAKFTHTNKLVSMLVKAFDNLDIELALAFWLHFGSMLLQHFVRISLDYYYTHLLQSTVLEIVVCILHIHRLN